MPYYVKIQNNEVIQFPIYEGDLKNLVGYDESSEVPFECPEGYAFVQDVPPPNFDWSDYTKSLSEKTPQLIDGKWTRAWAIEDASEEELSRRTNIKSQMIREERNKKLAETDWTQLSDSPAPSEPWKEYRQALRNIPQQSGFPWQIEWPIPPT